MGAGSQWIDAEDSSCQHVRRDMTRPIKAFPFLVYHTQHRSLCPIPGQFSYQTLCRLHPPDSLLTDSPIHWSLLLEALEHKGEKQCMPSLFDGAPPSQSLTHAGS